MKNIIFIALTLIASNAWSMTSLPEGTYQGHGLWKDRNGQTGQYELQVTVEDNIVSSSYTFDGNTQEFIFTAALDSEGFFEVIVDGQVVGSGFCMSVQCHYQAVIGRVTLQETLTFYENNLYRLGSKTIDGLDIIWEEATQRSAAQ